MKGNGTLYLIMSSLTFTLSLPYSYKPDMDTNSLQTLLGYFAFHEIITSGRLMGIILILTGGALYTWAKDKEMRANTKPTYIPMTQQDVDEEDDSKKGTQA